MTPAKPSVEIPTTNALKYQTVHELRAVNAAVMLITALIPNQKVLRSSSNLGFPSAQPVPEYLCKDYCHCHRHNVAWKMNDGVFNTDQ
ncbi:hypothetical protein O9993_14995 [Vibrio lentus]|nr:hypothetical protein [Vibrio lentus]